MNEVNDSHSQLRRRPQPIMINNHEPSVEKDNGMMRSLLLSLYSLESLPVQGVNDSFCNLLYLLVVGATRFFERAVVVVVAVVGR
jgi:hypothetical protein